VSSAHGSVERAGNRGRGPSGALAGLIALAVFLGIAELVAIATGPDTAPSIAIGQNAIAHTPEWLKEFAIRHFGENDKHVLLAGIYSTLALLSALAGAAGAATRRAVTVGAIAALGVAASISAATYPTGTIVSVGPSLAGAVVAAYAFCVLVKDRPNPSRPTLDNRSRRQVLGLGGAVLAGGAAAYVIGRVGLQSAYNAIASRTAVAFPKASSPLPSAGGKTGFNVPGLSSYITPNTSFYRVDTALVVPQINTSDYRLSIHGMVDNPATYTYDDILAMPLVERAITLCCVSNPVGGPYIGNAVWLGALLKPLLARAGVSPDADQLFMTSSDGMTIGADLRAATDGRDAMLAVGMNGVPLPFEHGFPVRMVIPGEYGYVSACKWLVDIDVTTYEARQAYWVPRGYSAQAPVKLESRIDTPRGGSHVEAGLVPVAGVAWRQHVGISRVQVSVDGGDWNDATLAAVDSPDTWRLWKWDWQATPGSHRLQVRATDAQGNVQVATPTPDFPNGATGWDTIEVTVT